MPPNLPNVVFFISDQQRADTMPGVRRVKAYTPHLEWLCERGVVFQNAFCTSPVCSPARSSILSGLYPHATGLVANDTHVPSIQSLSPEVRLLADYLKPKGYVCAYVGKWHLCTGSDRRGFSDFATRLEIHDTDNVGDDDAVNFAERIGVQLGRHYRDHLNDEDDLDRPGTGGSTRLPLAFHPSALQAQQAVRFVRTMQGESRPFLLVYSCQEPHPLGLRHHVCPRPFDRMYDPDSMPVPDRRRDPNAARLVKQRAPVWGFKHLIPADRHSDDELRAMTAGYYGAVSYVDHLLGIVLGALIETNQWNKTLFVFTSDHGEMLGNHGLLKKGCVLFEELVRVPLLVVPPGGSTSSRRTDQLVSQADLVPTVLNWCDAEVPAGLHGADIRPLIEGNSGPIHDGIALQFHSMHWGDKPAPLRGWRTETWKYVEDTSGPVELYDLRKDAGEMENLVGNPASLPVLHAMSAALHTWLKRAGDPWPDV